MSYLKIYIWLVRLFKIPHHTLDEWERKNLARNPAARFYVKVNSDGIHSLRAGGEDTALRSAGTSLLYFLSVEIFLFNLSMQKKLKRLKLIEVSPPGKGLDALIRKLENEKRDTTN